MKEVMRRERSDKKVRINPTVSIELYNFIEDLSYVTSKPIKDVAEFFCLESLESRKVIEQMSKWFKKDLKFNNTVYIGDSNLFHKRTVKVDGSKRRIYLKFTKPFAEQLSLMSGVVGMTLSSTTYLLLHFACKDINILDKFLNLYARNLDKERFKILKHAVKKYAVKNNPYGDSIRGLDIFDKFIYI